LPEARLGADSAVASCSQDVATEESLGSCFVIQFEVDAQHRPDVQPDFLPSVTLEQIRCDPIAFARRELRVFTVHDGDAAMAILIKPAFCNVPATMVTVGRLAPSIIATNSGGSGYFIRPHAILRHQQQAERHPPLDDRCRHSVRPRDTFLRERVDAVRFRSLSTVEIATVVFIVIAYLAATEFAKRWFFRPPGTTPA
jgi:hypothetical protein